MTQPVKPSIRQQPGSGSVGDILAGCASNDVCLGGDSSSQQQRRRQQCIFNMYSTDSETVMQLRRAVLAAPKAAQLARLLISSHAVLVMCAECAGPCSRKVRAVQHNSSRCQAHA